MNIFKSVIAFSIVSITFCSCLKQSYETPPSVAQLDPNLPVTMTNGVLAKMAESMPSSGAGSFRVMGDTTIEGIVVADDKSNNIFKQIVIEDATGGFTVDIAQYSIYNSYPIGRKIYIKLKGLVLANYNGLPVICFSGSVTGGKATLVGIPTSLESNYIVGASYPNVVTPIKVTITDLFTSTKYLNMLVSIDSMEFDATVVGKPYAPVPPPLGSSYASSLPANVCSSSSAGGSLIVYNSAFATFQPALVPNGKGTLTGIYSVYNTPQFLLRDTTDVDFKDPRECP